jgi:ribulose-bisphosphate carboxylase large chain
MSERITARYLIETPLSPQAAAEALARMSTGTFVAVPGETASLRERFGARVESVVPLGQADSPSLPGSRGPAGASGPIRYTRAEVVLSWPLENVGANIPTLLAMVRGNFYEMTEVSGLRLTDLELPESFAKAYPGPRFGIEGTRELTGVSGRPLIGTIIKPNIGMTPQQTGELARELAEAGIDFIKDDEVMANPPHSPLERRVESVMSAIDDVAQRTGKKVMYACNITDELDAMLHHQEAVARAGGNCVMVSLNSIGFVGLAALRRRCRLAIHGHRNGWGMWNRHPMLGVEFAAYQKLWRLTGADHLHVNGLANKFWEGDESVVKSIDACLAPLFDMPRPMPVLGSGQWGGQAPETYRRTRTVDVIYIAGGGILGHPGGPSAGVRALQQAWEAAVQGIPLEAHAASHPELRQTLEKFGRIRR